MKKDKQEYILRYYLPVKPYFDEEFTKKRFSELCEFCEKTKTGAVMLYVALSPDFYYMPDSVEYSRQVRDQMLPYIAELKKRGISYQLNFQNLVGSTLGGVDFSDSYDWEFLVDHKGKVSRGCGCPIGEKFRKNSEQRLKIWAETHPDVIWIDDDFRMHNHGTPLIAGRDEGIGPYMDYYCFCDNHISLFNKRMGTDYDRESLVKDILKEGKSEVRNAYLDFLSDTMEESASWIEKTVHSVDPKIRLAQMTSCMDVHSAEGRRWERFLPALCGEYTPIVRAHFGPYMEAEPRGFIDCYRMLSQTVACLGEKYEGEVEYAPEIENTRFTVWAKSARATGYQLALSAFVGCRWVTLSIYDLEGGAFSDEPKYKELLIKEKSFLDKIVGLELKKAKGLGVKIPISQLSGREYSLNPGEGYGELGGGNRYIERYLLTMGVPCVYSTDKELDGKGVVALDRFTANYLSDEKLLEILKGGVFLDGGAVDVLLKRGYGEYIGVKGIRAMPCIVNVEVIKSFTRDDGTYIRIPSRIPVYCWFDMDMDEKAQELSTFITPDGKEFVGMARYSNSLGGSVAIYPSIGNWGDGFYNHYRTDFVKDVLGELDKDLPRVDVLGAMLVAVRERSDSKYYLISNLAPDRSDWVTIGGKVVKTGLDLYQSAVFEEKNGKIKKIGKSRY